MWILKTVLSVCVEAKFVKKKKIEISNCQENRIVETCTDFKNTMKSMSKGGKKWYITFVDDCSRYTKVYLLKYKDEPDEMFLKYKVEVENQLDWKSRDLGMTGVGNMTPIPWPFFFVRKMANETSAPYKPQQDSVVERKKRTLDDMMNAMLVSSSLSDNMWERLSWLLVLYSIEFPIIN